ncbi:solute carrier organic anion transporter family member 4A1-like isoform X2 [Branchiostoma floridae x Branchiostoma japonicum]
MRTNMEDEGDRRDCAGQENRRDCAGQEKDKKLRDDNYGWGSFKPATLQVLNNPKAALVFLSCAIFTQAMTVNGLARSVVTTLERRFHLTSTDMGAVLIANDVANFVSSLPISYLGAKNKPRWLGSGMLLLAVGAFVFALPHFVAEPYQVVPTTSHELCRSNATNFSASVHFDSWNQTECGNTTSSTGQGIQGYMYVLVLGKFLIGIGACALFSLGVTYINENTPSNQSSVYLGIFYSFSIVGPAIGYLLACVFLKIPTDKTFPNIDPEHPQWIGAWWIGFILTGALAVVAAIFILGLPRRLSSKFEDSTEATITAETPLKEIQGDKTTLDDTNGDAEKLPSDTASPDQQNGGCLSLLHGVVEKSARIMQNPTFAFLSMATVTEKGIAAGIATFIAKYIESQFRTSAGEAAMLMGLVSIPGATIGTLLGGYLVKRFELQVRGIVKMCTVLTLLTMVSLLMFLIACEDVSMVGVNTAYHNSSHSPTSLIDGCNARCECSSDQYQPVCGGDELVYFSPCLAGCQGLTTSNGSQVYDNCTCLAGGFATSGICSVNCPLKPLFLVILFFMSLGMFITYIPLLTATLRAVTEEDGPFATGLQDAMIRGLGYIPCILLVGAVIDRACALQDSSCTNGGSCLLYVNRYFGLYLLAVCMAYKVTSCLFYALVLLFDRGEAHVEYSNIK